MVRCLSLPSTIRHGTGGNMTPQMKEELREILIDYLALLTSSVGISRQDELINTRRINKVRLLLNSL
jgi:hypothetical protein